MSGTSHQYLARIFCSCDYLVSRKRLVETFPKLPPRIENEAHLFLCFFAPRRAFIKGSR